MPDTMKKMYLEPTSRCNLHCQMCFRKTWIDEALADMDRTTFDRAINTMPDTVATVFFGGMGEPLAHKDIVAMVHCAASKGKQVELITNATLLSAEMSSQLLKAGLSALWVSIDSFEEQQYENIRKNSLLSIVKENIAHFTLLRRRKFQHATLNLAFVAMKSNVHQLAMIPRFASYYDVKNVVVSHIMPTDEASASEVLYDKVLAWNLGARRQQDTLPHVNIPMMDWNNADVMEGVQHLLASPMSTLSVSGHAITRPQKHCRFIEEGHVFIKHDGSVSPCMPLLHSATSYWQKQKRTVRHHSFGNVRHESLTDIWQAEPYSQFRERVKNFAFSPCFHCMHCEYWEENTTDCFGNSSPTCGACLWAEGLISCP